MCGNCVSNADGLLLGAAGAGTAAAALARRAKDALHGSTSSDRQAAAYAANARFLRSLGHDPAALLGPPPAVRQTSPARALTGAAGTLPGT